MSNKRKRIDLSPAMRAYLRRKPGFVCIDPALPRAKDFGGLPFAIAAPLLPQNLVADDLAFAEALGRSTKTLGRWRERALPFIEAEQDEQGCWSYHAPQLLPFIQIPAPLLALTEWDEKALRVYAVLAFYDFKGRDSGTKAHPSVPTIAKGARTNPSTVHRYLRLFERLHLMHIERLPWGAHTNRYTLHPPEAWAWPEALRDPAPMSSFLEGDGEPNPLENTGEDTSADTNARQTRAILTGLNSDQDPDPPPTPGAMATESEITGGGGERSAFSEPSRERGEEPETLEPPTEGPSEAPQTPALGQNVSPAPARSPRRRRNRRPRPAKALQPAAAVALDTLRKEWSRQSEGAAPPAAQERLLIEAAPQMARTLEELPARTLAAHLPARLHGVSVAEQVFALLRFMVLGLFLSEARREGSVALSAACLGPTYLAHRLADAKRAQEQRDPEDWHPRHGPPADPLHRPRYERYERAQERERRRAEARKRAAPYLEVAALDRAGLAARLEGIREQLGDRFGRLAVRARMHTQGGLLARAAAEGLEVADLRALYREALLRVDPECLVEVLAGWRLCEAEGVEPPLCPELLARAHALGLPCPWGTPPASTPAPPAPEEEHARPARQRLALRARVLGRARGPGELAILAARTQAQHPLGAEDLAQVEVLLPGALRAPFARWREGLTERAA